MTIVNPRIHMICGACGSNKDFKFKIEKELEDETGILKDVVRISCENCSTLTGLEEIINER